MRPRADRSLVSLAALGLGAAGAAASVAPLGAAIASLHRASSAGGRLRLAGFAFSYPRLNAPAWILFGLAVIGGSAIAIALRGTMRQRRAYRRFLAQLEIVGRLDGYPAVRVIADPRPQAFCAGYLRPRVYISRAAVEMLTAAELEAVLAHEHHHRRVRDPLRLACGGILTQGLFFVPALRALFGRYAALAELSADSAAVRAGTGGRAALASALLTFEATGVGIAPERVDSLLGRRVGWRRPWRPLTASAGSLSSLIALTWVASQAASAQASFNLPLLSAQPCIVLMTAIPIFTWLIVSWRGATGRRAA